MRRQPRLGYPRTAVAWRGRYCVPPGGGSHTHYVYPELSIYQIDPAGASTVVLQVRGQKPTTAWISGNNWDPKILSPSRMATTFADGYLFKDHLEVRAGVYQGVRGEGATNPFRTAGRVVWYPFDARTDFFYPGTTFGTKKVLAFGLSHDLQSGFQATGGDVYRDVPLRGNAVTLQASFVRLDGGSLLPALPEQDTFFVEAGFFVKSLKLTPWLLYSRRDLAAISRFKKHDVVWIYPFGLGGSPEVFEIPYDRISDDEITLIPLEGAVKRV